MGAASKKAEPAKKPVAGKKNPPAAKVDSPAKKAEVGKKGKGKGSEAATSKKAIVEPEVLAPRKGKGTKAAAIIAAITEASDHETDDPELEAKKGSAGAKGKKKTENEKKAAIPAKKP